MDPVNGDAKRFAGHEAGVEIVAYGRLKGPQVAPSSDQLDQQAAAEVSGGAILEQPVMQLVPRIVDGQPADQVQGQRILARFPATTPSPSVTALVFVVTLPDRAVTIRAW